MSKEVNQDVLMDVFHIDVENANFEEKTKKTELEFNPRQVTKDNPYRALVRLLPIPVKENGKIIRWEKEPYYMKKRYYLKDENNFGSYYDSPLTVGEKCPMQQMFFKLNACENVQVKALKEDFKLQTNYWGLVYVIADDRNPDNNGKVMPWRFPDAIKKLIEKSQLNKKYFNRINKKL